MLLDRFKSGNCLFQLLLERCYGNFGVAVFLSRESPMVNCRPKLNRSFLKRAFSLESFTRTRK